MQKRRNSADAHPYCTLKRTEENVEMKSKVVLTSLSPLAIHTIAVVSKQSVVCYIREQTTVIPQSLSRLAERGEQCG